MFFSAKKHWVTNQWQCFSQVEQQDSQRWQSTHTLVVVWGTLLLESKSDVAVKTYSCTLLISSELVGYWRLTLVLSRGFSQDHFAFFSRFLVVGKVTRYDVMKWYQVIIEVNFMFSLLFLWKMIRQAPKEKKKKLRMKNVEIRCFRLLMANFESRIQENDCLLACP